MGHAYLVVWRCRRFGTAPCPPSHRLPCTGSQQTYINPTKDSSSSAPLHFFSTSTLELCHCTPQSRAQAAIPPFAPPRPAPAGPQLSKRTDRLPHH
ncbi:hypothetical protein DAI22_02g177401 [Oryza sativa Japonica Group]|nr:hypothetical protein DAI22_02g177401 [Oryza sativa Japonica Group]